MKTTIEIPDELFRRSKATAALRGESLKDLVAKALEAHLGTRPPARRAPHGWRSVFGRARREEVALVDAKIAEEFERVDLEAWR